MGKATNPRKPGVSTGGRPPKEGDRYPGGKLKRPGPNQLMLDRRKALCADVTMASCPLDAAYSNGWLSTSEYAAGQAYIAIHARAKLGSPSVPSQADHSRPDPVADIRRVTWAELSHDEIARIWDSAMRDIGTEGAAARMEESNVKAMADWKKLNAAMSLRERMEVDRVCLGESWPQWIIQRAAGRMDTTWEANRVVLVSGLKAIHVALRKPKPETTNQDDAADPIHLDAPTRVVERTVYLGEDGETVLEVERVSRR